MTAVKMPDHFAARFQLGGGTLRIPRAAAFAFVAAPFLAGLAAEGGSSSPFPSASTYSYSYPIPCPFCFWRSRCCFFVGTPEAYRRGAVRARTRTAHPWRSYLPTPQCL